jgi:hypothetical protein
MRPLRTLLAAGLLAFALVGATTGGALAYGKADQPLAQIEFSANCNNPSIPLCFTPPAGFGVGGIWLWIEIDANQTGDVADAACGHIKGLGAGAGSIRGDITWWPSTGPEGVSFAVDPNDRYYNVDLGIPGEPPFAFPMTVGHYSFKAGPGVTVQTTIAP